MAFIPPGEKPNGFEEYNDYQLPNFDSSGVSDGDRVVAESNRRLKKSMDTFNTKTSKQTNWIIGLTIAMLITAIAQIGLLIYSIFS